MYVNNLLNTHVKVFTIIIYKLPMFFPYSFPTEKYVYSQGLGLSAFL